MDASAMGAFLAVSMASITRSGDYLERSNALQAEETALVASQDSPEPTVTAEEALEYLRNLPETVTVIDDRGRSDLLHGIYQRVDVLGDEFVRVTLTPEAESHGLALALPERVAVPCCNGRGERI